MPTVFDPTTRLETWLFQEIGRAGSAKGKPVYRQLQYVLVSYDGDPQQFIEPLPADDFLTSVGAQSALTAGTMFGPVNPVTDGLGRVVGFLFVTKRFSEVFAYNDVDALNNLGQLPNLDARGQILSATA